MCWGIKIVMVGGRDFVCWGINIVMVGGRDYVCWGINIVMVRAEVACVGVLRS